MDPNVFIGLLSGHMILFAMAGITAWRHFPGDGRMRASVFATNALYGAIVSCVAAILCEDIRRESTFFLLVDVAIFLFILWKGKGPPKKKKPKPESLRRKQKEFTGFFTPAPPALSRMGVNT